MSVYRFVTSNFHTFMTLGDHLFWELHHPTLIFPFEGTSWASARSANSSTLLHTFKAGIGGFYQRRFPKTRRMQSWKEKTKKKCWDCEWNWTFSSGCKWWTICCFSLQKLAFSLLASVCPRFQTSQVWRRRDTTTSIAPGRVAECRGVGKSAGARGTAGVESKSDPRSWQLSSMKNSKFWL